MSVASGCRSLANSGLTGPLSEFSWLANQTFLRTVTLANNRLTGPLPPSWTAPGAFQSLLQLSLRNSEFQCNAQGLGCSSCAGHVDVALIAAAIASCVAVPPQGLPSNRPHPLARRADSLSGPLPRLGGGGGGGGPNSDPGSGPRVPFQALVMLDLGLNGFSGSLPNIRGLRGRDDQQRRRQQLGWGGRGAASVQGSVACPTAGCCGGWVGGGAPSPSSTCGVRGAPKQCPLPVACCSAGCADAGRQPLLRDAAGGLYR